MMSQQAVIVSLLTDATKHLTRGSTQRQRRIQYDTTPSLYPACVSERAKDYSASIVLSRGSTEKKTIEITFFKSERSPWSPVSFNRLNLGISWLARCRHQSSLDRDAENFHSGCIWSTTVNRHQQCWFDRLGACRQHLFRLLSSPVDCLLYHLLR